MIEQIAFMALGGVIGTLWWIVFIWKIFYPKMREMKQYFEDKYEAEKKAFEDKLNNILAGKDAKVNTILDDTVPKITEKLREEFKTILDKETPKIAVSVLSKFKPPLSEEVSAAVYSLVDCAYNAYKANSDIQRSVQGEINGRINGVVGQIEKRFNVTEEDMQNFRLMLEWFAANKDKLAGLANMAGGGGEGGFNPMQMFGQMFGGQQP
ncbi:hypothetical protein KAR91_29740 [Candidatus Pacearchaeota archaeon]|nr:hypothetical protein [Candidatus Pacearchaeota archaeon]